VGRLPRIKSAIWTRLEIGMGVPERQRKKSSCTNSPDIDEKGHKGKIPFSPWFGNSRRDAVLQMTVHKPCSGKEERRQEASKL